MRVYVQRANAFDRYSRAESSSVKIIGAHHHYGTIVRQHGSGIHRDMLSDVYCCCYMCIEMARDTPGSPMPRPRDLGAGGGAATATLTSGAYHAAAVDPANLHDQHVLQQKMLEQHHQLQHQLLRQQYQVQERQLVERHEQEMQQLKVWEHQKQQAERREKERLEALKKKDKHDHSANASTEVKERLHNLN